MKQVRQTMAIRCPETSPWRRAAQVLKQRCPLMLLAHWIRGVPHLGQWRMAAQMINVPVWTCRSGDSLAGQYGIYFTVLALVPLLGSFITEPAAMTLAALILGNRLLVCDISLRLKYATMGVLFVNI